MRLPVAKDGWPIILGAFGVSVIAGLLSYLFGLWPLSYFSGLALAFALFSLYFFRDPERLVPVDENAILSPADGKVIDIRDVEEPTFCNGLVKRISIFMSVADVHVNRSPVAGKVVFENYNPGEFQLAWRDKASELNEQNSIGIMSKDRKFLVRQIAGYVARRIVCTVKPEQELAQGERFGMIRFGSRVDLFFPADGIEIKVKPGQYVFGGTSVIGIIQ